MKMDEMSIETALELKRDGIALEVNDGEVVALVGEWRGETLWRVEREA